MPQGQIQTHLSGTAGTAGTAETPLQVWASHPKSLDLVGVSLQCTHPHQRTVGHLGSVHLQAMAQQLIGTNDEKKASTT